MDYGDRTATQKMLINPQPPYNQDWNGWGPRLGLDYALGKHTVLHAGGAITTLHSEFVAGQFSDGGDSVRVCALSSLRCPGMRFRFRIRSCR